MSAGHQPSDWTQQVEQVQQAQVVVTAFKATLDDLHLTRRRRNKANRAFLKHLGRGPEASA